MAMYTQLLSAVFMSDATEAATPGELLAVARLRRHQLLAAADHAHSSAERDLAFEVDYDCALIRLCLGVGLAATPASFGRPLDERARLERALSESGVDLMTADLHE